MRATAEHHAPDPGRQSRVVLRALAAMGALLALVGGVPIVLLRLSRALPLDLGALAPRAWAHADDGRLLLLVIVGVAWAAWALLVLSVAVEFWSALRRVPTPELPGMAVPQRASAALVAAVLVALSPMSGSEVAAVAAPSPATASASVGAPTSSAGVAAAGSQTAAAVIARSDELEAGPRGSQAQGPARDGFARSKPEPSAPTVTTQRHDTLWLLAETYLGSGERYAEIVDLNRDSVQPDGRRLGDGGRVYPGWTLALPADARVDADRPERHLVVPGDTLWEIAGAELGDPTRYPEIAKENRGDRQPDGRHLEDPSLILPGWVVEIPGSGSKPAVRDHDGDNPEADLATDEITDAIAHAAALPSTELAPIDRAPDADDRGHPTGPEPDRGTSNTPTSSSVPAPSEPRARPDVQADAQPDAQADAQAGAQADAQPDAQAGAQPEDSADDRADVTGTGIMLPAGGVASALLLAGVGSELVRRRRQFQRHRRPGERMPAPTAGGQGVERAARTAAHEPGLTLLDRALTDLAEHASLGRVPVPDVRIVRVSADSVVLLLAAPMGAAIAPFTADHDTRWVLDPEQLSTETPDRQRALPGLITLGFAGEESILLNLESVGTLAVTGEAEVVAGVLRGLAAELALGPVSKLSERLLCVADPSIEGAVEAGAIGVERDPDRARAALVETMRSDPLGAGKDGDLLIVLCDQQLDVQVPAGSGCALITTAPSTEAGATLVVRHAGDAVLLPGGEPLVPQSLSHRSTDDIVDVLSATAVPDSVVAGAADPVPGESVTGHDASDLKAGETRLSSSTPTAPPVIDLRERTRKVVPPPTAGSLRTSVDRVPGVRPEPGESAAPRPTADPIAPTGAIPRILVLGEIQVEHAHGRSESSRIGRLAETAAFVLMNPGSRQSELQGALWPAIRSNPQTCRQMISRTRTWLGRTDEGEPFLMNFAETSSRLRLRPEVTSDWADFQRLAAIGLADPGDTEHLTEALSLVRGRPFGAVASRELPWADLHINEMISLITDVAHALALRHEEAGRRSAACAAALRGLSTDSDSEVLEAIVARTAR